MLLALLFSLMTTPRVVEVKLGPVQREVLRAQDRYLDVEGALRSAKTWTILIKLRKDLEEYPGMPIAISRWLDGDLHQKLIPAWREICALMEIPHGEWNARESCYDFPNGSRCYCVHLKASQKDNRFAKVRGLKVAKFYIDQLEEVPQDVYQEAALRLSAPGFPHQMIVSPNAIPESHWIAKRETGWPKDNSRQNHRYIRLSVWDNRHNLDASMLDALEILYPVGHPMRRTKLEGHRGLEVNGTPVYSGAFKRERHVRSIEINPNLPLLEAYDYGFHHPCVVWGQYGPWGHVRILGGVLGSDLHINKFLPIVERYRNLWFPQRLRLALTCDPAGAANNSQGMPGTPVGLISDWMREHSERDQFGEFVTPLVHTDANQPEIRYAQTELLSTYMQHHVNGAEAFLVDPERWVVAELNDERQDSFFVDGLEAGYVLEDEARHSSKLGTFYVPKKDGYFEHPMNCTEYLCRAYVRDLPLNGERAAKAVVAHKQETVRAQQIALRKQQQDLDPDDLPRVRQSSGSGRGFSGRHQRRGGY